MVPENAFYHNCVSGNQFSFCKVEAAIEKTIEYQGGK